MTDTPDLRGWTHVSLSVSDLDRSRHFYHEVLSLPLLMDIYEGTVLDGRELMVLVHLAFAVPSIKELDAWAERLSSAGVPHSGVKPLPGFGDFIELRDPDEIQPELHCLRSPDR
jgi:glyoxylase I family protein